MHKKPLQRNETFIEAFLIIPQHVHCKQWNEARHKGFNSQLNNLRLVASNVGVCWAHIKYLRFPELLINPKVIGKEKKPAAVITGK